MRDYIIINGKRSTLIEGLLISKLPPITKPMMRTQIEVIDGRDGDLVTPLGYAAYDKSVEIGLYGNYDIDAVISYFSQSGTVTFSNEPTKFYKFESVNQIDFEKLIRFKTANVVFHVQPYKYSLIDAPITHDSMRLISIPPKRVVKNGLTVETNSVVILGKRLTAIGISGTATTGTEIYIPVNTVTLPHGDYSLMVDSTGSGSAAIKARLINDSPSVSNTFGGGDIQLVDNDVVTVTQTFVDTKTYNYLYFYVSAGQAVDIATYFRIADIGMKTVIVTNAGNTYAMPKITLYGEGDVSLRLNSVMILLITISNEGQITIDTDLQDAYYGNIGNLRNRAVDGDYSSFRLLPGANEIAYTGNVSKIVIENYTRWL